MNCVQLTGRLTQDPQLVEVNDAPLCRIRLAVDNMSRGKETGFIDVTTFGKSAEAAARILKRGWLVAVSGRLDYRHWTDDQGKNRSAIAVVGNVEFLSAPRGTPPEPEDQPF